MFTNIMTNAFGNISNESDACFVKPVPPCNQEIQIIIKLLVTNESGRKTLWLQNTTFQIATNFSGLQAHFLNLLQNYCAFHFHRTLVFYDHMLCNRCHLWPECTAPTWPFALRLTCLLRLSVICDQTIG